MRAVGVTGIKKGVQGMGRGVEGLDGLAEMQDGTEAGRMYRGVQVELLRRMQAGTYVWGGSMHVWGGDFHACFRVANPHANQGGGLHMRRVANKALGPLCRSSTHHSMGAASLPLPAAGRVESQVGSKAW